MTTNYRTGADTIFALASGALPAGLAVIRVSGPAAGPAITGLTGGPLPQPRRATLAVLGSLECMLDRGLVIWFPGPQSFTGEDVAEFHIHGGRAVAAAVLTALAGIDGLRPAAAGEFTRRALANGKMDLTAAEGLADLVAAETEAQRIQALRQAAGALGQIYDRWRDGLTWAMARLEAAIDFSGEDLPPDLINTAAAKARAIADEMDAHLADARRGERLRDGLRAAIIGAPNVGKSSLFNMLVQRDAAIVSGTAGTTRDVIEAHLDLGGYPVLLADTAGLDRAEGDVEAEGMRRALARAAGADLKIAVFDATLWPETDAATVRIVDEDTLVVLNKCDLALPPSDAMVGGTRAIAVSAKTGEGVDNLLKIITKKAAIICGLVESPALTRARHRAALEESRAALGRFFEAANEGKGPEIAAEELRLAQRALGRITGRVDVEDLLDVIFSDFCIGK
ncbi:MAG TPA: tRNA uridine-5-carboxymethylaminomethyl(34) synthesis GTPase MnmE [Alphaproteobacteria bacterium]|nr:tRNA uridine-5-carboxymethylaminomethyl(34) synthesis GTPase MnmE [Alphaproteobacteria bacterium]